MQDITELDKLLNRMPLLRAKFEEFDPTVHVILDSYNIRTQKMNDE